MINHVYTHKGITYKRTRKDVAMRRILQNHDLHFFLVGCNVNKSHFHSGWHIAGGLHTMNAILKSREGMETDCKKAVENLYNAASFYLEPELGRYPVYYVEVK